MNIGYYDLNHGTVRFAVTWFLDCWGVEVKGKLGSKEEDKYRKYIKFYVDNGRKMYYSELKG